MPAPIRKIRDCSTMLLVVGAVCCVPSACWSAREDGGPPDPDPGRFAEEIAAFEEADRLDPPGPGSLLFLGSSSVKLWDLGASFPGLDATNRGFGGSQLSDILHYADRVVSPHRPRTIVLYAGENDVAAGKSADRVLGDFLRLVDLIEAAAPGASVLYLSIKPSPSRLEHWPEMQRANALIRRACEASDRLRFVDVARPMLDARGQPRPELYDKDELHLNARGYALWSSVLTPLLTRAADAPSP